MIADPHAVAARWPAPRVRALAALARAVTLAPWALTAADRAAATAAGLDDEAILHAVALAAYFGHLNRIADVVAVPLDYDVVHRPPPLEAAVPPLAPAPWVVDDPPAIDLALRPATALALDAWRVELFERDPGWLSAARRAWLADLVAGWLGAPGPAAAPPPDEQAAEQRALAELITLAPWQVDDAALAPLRARGWDDAGLFDLAAVISTATVLVRIEVALRALGRG